jgi:HAD superfamily hydrolase (TIGR01509 family)
MRVAGPEAFLVDVYETILTAGQTAGFAQRRRELAAMAGVPAEAWNAGLVELAPQLNDGRLALADAFERIIRARGGDPRPELVHEIVREDRELLLSSARLYDDAIGFLELLRSRGILIAIVSNCNENTRPLLYQLGISDLADALVLSCEVGYAKPAAQVYRHALDRLGVAPGAAVFVDDQRPFCAGAAALGIRAVQIIRDDADGRPAGPGTPVVRSLQQLETML